MGLTLLVLGLLAVFGLAVTDVRTDRIDEMDGCVARRA